MGRGAAGAFAATSASRYVPFAGVHATRECDTVVRMSSVPHESLLEALLSANDESVLRLATPAELGPHVWLEASMALDSALCNASFGMSPAALLDGYTQALEAATFNLEHEFLAQPILSILGVWVGEQDTLAHLESVSPSPLLPLRNTSSPLPANHTDQAPPLRVVLVARSGSRQDDAALLDARAAVEKKLPPESVAVLRLGGGVPADDPESLETLMALLGSVARANLSSLLRQVSAETERIRRASRSSFKSWFGVSTGKQHPTLSSSLGFGASATSTMGSTGVASYSDSNSPPGRTLSPGVPNTTPSVAAVRGPPPVGRHRRRTSSMNGVIPTPLFPPDSLESLSRHVADLLLLSGDYEGAGEAYRTLATEVSGCAGPATVHEASAVEHTAIALALADGSKREVGSGLERSIKLYARAGRRELAVRTALRAAEYCVDAGFSDSAAGVLDRALSVTFPNVASSRASGGSFAESAAAILLARTAFMFVRMGRRRKASLYAYMAASRLSNETFHAAAAVIARDIDDSALLRPNIRDEVELLFGRAALALNEPERAEGHFSGVMARATELTDVEVQSRAILGFFDAVGKQPSNSVGRSRRWDSGAPFPRADLPSASVLTVDSQSAQEILVCSPTSGESESVGAHADPLASAGDTLIRQDDGSVSDGKAKLWKALDNDILEDMEYFNALHASKVSGRPVPKRERCVEEVISELRHEKATGEGVDPGGSLESKINRMRESAGLDSCRRRRSALLDTGAVVGELLSLQLTLQNPLQFPVFVEEARPVVILDGKVFDAISDDPLVIMKPVNDIVIMPASSKSIKLNITVNQSGSLRFIGARWMFSVGRSTSAQDGNRLAAGFCLLERRGPRLNASRRQRASEVPMYGEDLSLKLDVIPPAPRLQMRFSGKESDHFEPSPDHPSVVKLKAGQKVQTSITIKNCGQGAMDFLVFRIGTPQSLFLDVASRDGFESISHGEDLASSSVVSPTVAGCLPCRLKPGQSVELPVWLFGSGGGETDVRFAIGYGDRTRVCRLSCKLVVSPSLNIFPRFIRRMAPQAQAETSAPDSTLGSACEKFDSPSLSDVIREERESYLVGIEVEHTGKMPGDGSFTVHDVSVSSVVGWDAQKLPSPVRPAACEHLSGKTIRSNLRINETSTLFFVISRPIRQDHDASRSQMKTSSISLARQSANVIPNSNRESADSALRASEHFLLTSGHARRMGATSRKFVHTIVSWRSSHGHEGDLYLAPLDPSDWVGTTGVESESDSILGASRGTLPVEVRIVHQKKISHAFKCRVGDYVSVVPAVVPVDFFIRNTCDVLLDAVISAPVAGGIADGDRGRFWGGLVDATLRAIPPGIERRVCFSAILDSPGTYDLAKLVTKVRRHRGLGPASEPVPTSRSFSNELQLGELVPSQVVVEDISPAILRRNVPSPNKELETISYKEESPLIRKLDFYDDEESPTSSGQQERDFDNSREEKPTIVFEQTTAGPVVNGHSVAKPHPRASPEVVRRVSLSQSHDSAWDDGDSSADDLT